MLSSSHSRILSDERTLLGELHRTLFSMDAPKETLDLIADTKSRIDDLFLIPCVGEFNAGKSSFINALLGKEVLLSGVLPTTSAICLIKGAETTEVRSGVDSPSTSWRKADNFLLDDVQEISLPLDWLRFIALLDTPGTNALMSRHEQLTQSIIPRADLVLFVTSAERPMAESESNFLAKIAKWGKKVIIILNKIDILRSDDERQKVMDFVRINAAARLSEYSLQGTELKVFPVSSRAALEAKLAAGSGADPSLGPQAAQWEASGLRAVENHMRGVLGRQDLVTSKLEGPLGVADRIIAECLQIVHERSAALDSDRRTLEMIDESMGVFASDLRRDVKYFRQSAEALLLQTMARADTFLEKKVSIFAPALLLDAAEFQREFEAQVLVDLRRPIEDVVKDVGALVEQRARAQAASVIQFIGPAKKGRKMVGAVVEVSAGNFERARLELGERIRRDTGQILDAKGLSKDAYAVSQSVRSGAWQTAGIEGVAALTAVLASLSLIDFTGVIAAGTMGALGLVVLPWRKSQARGEFEERVTALRTQLDLVIENNFERELVGVKEMINSSVGPYRAFVSIETERNAKLQKQLLELRQTARDIKKRLA